MFGQPPRLTPFSELPKGVDHCIMEEDLAVMMVSPVRAKFVVCLLGIWVQF